MVSFIYSFFKDMLSSWCQSTIETLILYHTNKKNQSKMLHTIWSNSELQTASLWSKDGSGAEGRGGGYGGGGFGDAQFKNCYEVREK